MELLQLEYFITVANFGSITKAASVLYVSQPAVSATVKRLEDELGTELFTRGAKGVELTEAGKMFYERAVHVRKVLAAAKSDVKSGNELDGSITIGMNVASMYLMEHIKNFRRKYPRVSFNIASKYGGRSTDGLSSMYDLMVVYSKDYMDVSCVRFGVKYETGILLNASHPLASRQSLNIEELKDEQFIFVSNRSGKTSLDELRMRAFGITPHVVMTCDFISAKWAAVAAGIGIAFEPVDRLGIAQRIPQLAVVPLENSGVEADSHYLVWREDTLIPAARAFIDFVAQEEREREKEGMLL